MKRSSLGPLERKISTLATELDRLENERSTVTGRLMDRLISTPKELESERRELLHRQACAFLEFNKKDHELRR